MASLKGVSSVLLRVRDALPQLAAAGKLAAADEYLVAYIYFDAWDLGGLDLTVLNDTFGEG